MTPEGRCPACEYDRGEYDHISQTMTCRRCRLPWPTSYWSEQVPA